MLESRKTEVWRQVEKLRTQHESLQPGKLPLDLVSFIELEIRLDIMPFDGLHRMFGADAALLCDFTGMYVDEESYRLLDHSTESQLNRLRFSLAHELGHFYLHRELFKEQNISEESHLLEWLNQHEGVKYRIEQEANEFAGRLLVPREALLNHFDEMKRALTKMHGTTHWQNDIHIREKACELIAPKFGVHRQSIATRFDREGIWQSP